MSEFRGFDWNDPGLRAPSPEERMARAALSPRPSESAPSSGSPLPTGPALAVESPLPAAHTHPADSPLLLGKPFHAGSALPVGPALRLGPAHPVGPAVPASSPRPVAPASPTPQKTFAGDRQSLAPPQRTISPSSTPLPPVPRAQAPSTFQRAVSVFRAALPLVRHVLPLLDGNVGTAVSNLMAPRPQTIAPPPPPPPPVNLAPIESGLAKLQVQHRELRDQVSEQNESLKKVEDQLQHVREATDRNTLEQQELLEDLKAVGTKVNIFAYIALVLLGLSVALNVVLYIQIRHILR